MRILLDEDLASRELIARLRELGTDLLQPDRGATDESVWAIAQRELAAILTANVIDFLGLANRAGHHHGLLLVYRTNNRRTDLRAADIAAGVRAISDAYPNGVESLVLAVNDFIAAELDGVLPESS